MRVVVVHNRNAGDGAHDHHRLLELIEGRGHEVIWYSRDDPVWHDALSDLDASVELVAAAGGDGTVEAVVRVMAGRRTPVTVLPLGTANNISSALGLADVPLEALIAGWTGAAVQPIDLGVARGPWGTTRFVESVGVGLLADGMAAMDGTQANLAEMVDDPEARLTIATDVLRWMLATIPARALHLTVDGEDIPGEYVLVEAFNLGVAGPNLRLAPDADPADGCFDVVLAREAERRGLIAGLPAYRLDPEGAPRLPTRRARHVTISSGDYPLHVDDEVYRGTEEWWTAGAIDLTVEPGAIRLLVPMPDAGRRP